jgi:hypothetical protein
MFWKNYGYPVCLFASPALYKLSYEVQKVSPPFKSVKKFTLLNAELNTRQLTIPMYLQKLSLLPHITITITVTIYSS